MNRQHLTAVGVARNSSRQVSNGEAGGKGDANYSLFSTRLDYFLFKRTDVYTRVVYEKHAARTGHFYIGANR